MSEIKIDYGQTIHRVTNWIILAFIAILTYLANEVRSDVKNLMQSANDERVVNAEQAQALKAHEHRISQLEKIQR